MPRLRMTAILVSALLLSACEGPVAGYSGYAGAPGYYPAPGYGYAAPYAYDPGYVRPYSYGPSWREREGWRERQDRGGGFNQHHEQARNAPPRPQPQPSRPPASSQTEHNRQLLDQLGFRPSH
jgi:hypothetical protein